MRVQVFVADDGMCAWASIVAGDAGDASGLADVDAALATAGVCLGVDENARASLATELADPLYQVVRFDLAHGLKWLGTILGSDDSRFALLAELALRYDVSSG